jgi:hypothetical protein
MDEMQTFKTNDNVSLKYVDTGAVDESERGKPWLIFVCRLSLCSVSKGLYILIL